MIYIINKEPQLRLFIQNATKSAQIGAGALYQNVSVGDKFDCVLDLDNGSILKSIETEVTSILLKDQPVLHLPKLRGGEVGLSICEKDFEWLREILKTKKVLLSREENVKFNIYSKDVVQLEQTQNNAQVQRVLPRLGLDPSNDNLLFIAKAITGDVSLGNQFDLIWDMDSVEINENNPVRLEAIYSRNLQPEKILYGGIPALVLLSKSNDDIQTEDNPSLLNSFSNHLMIGKRVILSDSIEGKEHLPN